MNDAREQGEKLATALVNVIEQARWDAKIRSARDLALRAGMTHTYLYARLAGEVVLNIRDLGALGDALGVAPADLIRRAQRLVSDGAYALAAQDEVTSIEEEQEGGQE